MKILVTPTSFPRSPEHPAYAALTEFADEVIWNPGKKPLQAAEIPSLLDGCDGWIAGLDDINAAVFEQIPDTLKVISRYGVGVERVDLPAASRKGIAVTNTPGVNAEAVADLTFGLILAVIRRIPALDRLVKAGEWPRTKGMELPGKTIGIIGLGAIGRAVACRATGFSMKVIAYDPFMDEAYAMQRGITVMALDLLVETADIVSLHLPLTPETANILDAKRIAKMKPGVVIINTARGGLADEEALRNGMENGRIGGLGLDAFMKEPPGAHPLFAYENVVATPHAGAHTVEAGENMARMAVENLIEVLTGHPCRHQVNRSPGTGSAID